MFMEMIDCKGLNCPEPVLKAKAFLEKSRVPFRVEVDNSASKDNVLRFGRSQKCLCTSESLDNGNFLITLSPGKETGFQEQDFAESDYNCDLPEKSGLVYIISSDTMGRGDDELGWALLQTYMATIAKVSPLPEKIFFYNSGVKLVASEGKALEAICDLAERGVEIYSCGTCLEFFHLENNLNVGEITNMYDILDSMAQARQLVSPF